MRLLFSVPCGIGIISPEVCARVMAGRSTTKAAAQPGLSGEAQEWTAPPLAKVEVPIIDSVRRFRHGRMARACLRLGTYGPIKAASCNACNSRSGVLSSTSMAGGLRYGAGVSRTFDRFSNRGRHLLLRGGSCFASFDPIRSQVWPEAMLDVVNYKDMRQFLMARSSEDVQHNNWDKKKKEYWIS
jgi:hypothetical protein